MANLATFGLGGAGVGITIETIEWAKKDLKNPLEDVEKYGCWIYGVFREDDSSILDTGLGVLALDANSGEFEQAVDIGEMKGRRVLTSNSRGFGGNWKKQYDDLMEEIKEKEGKRGPPYPGKKGGIIDFFGERKTVASDGVIPIFSMDGGAGSGIFRFILESRDKIIDPKVPFYPLLTMPSVTELKRERRRENTKETLEYVSEKVSEEKMNYGFVICNDMALFQYAKIIGKITPETIYDINSEISMKLEDKDFKGMSETISEYKEYLGEGLSIRDANPLMVATLVPFFVSALGKIFVSSIAYKEPKGLDLNDPVEIGTSASFCVPGYDQTSLSLEGMDKKYSTGKYKGISGWIENIISNMLIPSYFSYDDLGNILSGLLVVIWGEKPVGEYYRDDIANAIKEHYGVRDLEIYNMTGRDPLKDYKELSNANYRGWIYAKIKDEEMLKAKVYGAE